MTTGERIRKYRHMYGYKQSDLARQAGCSTQVISNIERGITEVSVGTAVKIADTFQLPVDALLQDPDKEKDQLSCEECYLITGFRRLDPAGRKMLLDLINFFAARNAGDI